jgi:hypothetical protein
VLDESVFDGVLYSSRNLQADDEEFRGGVLGAASLSLGGGLYKPPRK